MIEGLVRRKIVRTLSLMDLTEGAVFFSPLNPSG